MRKHGMRALVRLVLLAVFMGGLPPAAPPRPRAAALPALAQPAPAAQLSAIESPPVPHPEPPPPSLPAHAKIGATASPSAILSHLPLAFTPNLGQTHPQVRYHSQAMGGQVFFTSNAVVLALPMWPVTATQALKSLPTHPITTSVIMLDYIGAPTAPSIAGSDPLPGVTHYLQGSSRASWRSDITSYGAIVYQQMYPGIDLRFDGGDGHLKSSYLVGAGADARQIGWRYRGASNLQLDASGNLQIDITSRLRGTRPISITEAAPVAWQAIGGQRVPVAVQYRIAADRSIGFSLGTYDPRYALTIDPVLEYRRTFGGSGSDEGLGIAIDKNGNTYITGYTDSPDFPVNGAYQPGPGGGSCGPNPCWDAFVTKLDPSGTQRLYSTYLGGTTSDQGNAIAVDAVGNAYITGEAGPGFPTTSGAFQASQAVAGSIDAFVSKLNPSGGLLYSTYLGGGSDDSGNGIAIDATGNAYIAGDTTSGFPGTVAFPTLNAYQSSYQGAGSGSHGDAFVTKLNASGSGLVYSTYLGGSGNDVGYAIAVDSNGSAYVTGGTQSPTFPTLYGMQAFGGGTCNTYACSDAFITKFSPAGSTLAYSTFLGGNQEDIGMGIGVDLDTNQGQLQRHHPQQ